MIIAAAIKINHDGAVWSLPRPARHCHVINAWVDVHHERLPTHVQGFIDSERGFVGRSEAGRVAYEQGQVSVRRDTLYSEDLW